MIRENREMQLFFNDENISQGDIHFMITKYGQGSGPSTEQKEDWRK